MYISNNIKVLRKLERLSQTELANKLGLKMANLSSYERGRSEPPISTLRLLSIYFSYMVDDLLFTDLSDESVREEKRIVRKKTNLDYAKAIENNEMTIDQVADEIGDFDMQRVNELLELRINELERAIKRDNPELAKELRIK